jgi:hypothetical protein
MNLFPLAAEWQAPIRNKAAAMVNAPGIEAHHFNAEIS